MLAGAGATLASLPVDRFSLGLLVGWAFAIAASFLPEALIRRTYARGSR